MSRRDRINAARSRAHRGMVATYSGVITGLGDDPEAPLECAVRIGATSRETVDGGFASIRGATVLIAKSTLPELPDLSTHPVVEIAAAATRPGQYQPAEKFRLMEHHEQSISHWFLRAAQWE